MRIIDGYRVEVDEIDQDSWESNLGGFSDANIYQSWSYGLVRWGRRNLSHVVIKEDGVVVAMAQLRIVQPAGFKCGVAYLRWGPVCERKEHNLDQRICNAIAEALYEEYVVRRRLFLRILPQGVKNSNRACVIENAFRSFRSESFHPSDSYRTMIVDLSHDVDELRKNLDQKWRNQLNRSERNNLTIVEGEGDREFEIMSELYREMWERKRFARGSDIYEYAKIQVDLPSEQKMKVFLCLREGKPISGVVVTALGTSGIYLFGGTSNDGMQSKGAYILQWRAMLWCKEKGMRYYNLGGINPVLNPGVHHFKKGMSGDDVLYLEPMVACVNPLSNAFAKVGFGLRDKIRSVVKVS